MAEPPTWKPTRRPLTPAEQRVIHARIRNLRARGRRASSVSLPITAGIVLVLWGLTMLLSDASWLVITAFWVIVGAVLAAWVGKDLRHDGGQMLDIASRLESALRQNTADVYDVRASAFAEIEEVEDEGACYAFAIEDGRLAFIQGQEFYAGAKFPSLDFSLVYVIDDTGQTIDMLIEKRGAKAAAARKIPADVKQRLTVPEHLEVRLGRLEDLEALLR